MPIAAVKISVLAFSHVDPTGAATDQRTQFLSARFCQPGVSQRLSRRNDRNLRHPGRAAGVRSRFQWSRFNRSRDLTIGHWSGNLAVEFGRIESLDRARPTATLAHGAPEDIAADTEG